MLSRAHQMQLRRRIAARRGNVLIDKLAAAARLFLVGYENLDWDPSTNGELRALKIILDDHLAPMVVDVGANHGEWSAAALDVNHNARVHAFEVVPEVCATLAARFEFDRRITVHAVGLSDMKGPGHATYDRSRDTLSRVVRAAADESLLTPVVLTTGDDWCVTDAIDHIDLLKIDAEGHDLRVLHGFRSMIEAALVDVVQFEHNRAGTSEGVLLRDFYELLSPAGYVVGKIHPQSVDLRPYRLHSDEDFVGMNYLAVHQTHQRLISRLIGQRRERSPRG